MPELRPFAIERWFAQYEQAVELDLAETSVEPLSTAELLAFAGLEHLPEAVLRKPLKYAWAKGDPALRERIAAFVPNTRPDEVLVTTGAIEADYLLFRTLVRPGDTVIVQFPLYQALYSVAEAQGARVVRWELREADGFRPDLDRLRGLLDASTRLVVVNNPHNPTGAVLSRAELEELCGLAERRGFVLLVDEVYHGLTLDDAVDAAPPVRAIDPRAVHVGSTSKALGAPGLRLGWMAGPRAIVDAAWAYKDYTSLTGSPLTEILAGLLFDHLDRVMERNLRLARNNFRIFDAWVRENSDLIAYVPPRAGVVCYPRYLLDMPSEAFCRGLIEAERVLTVPGSCFEQEGHFRVGFGYDTGRLETALDRFTRYLDRFRTRAAAR